jgi:hypothetical protein
VPPLTCTRRRSCTATSKPANLLVFSLSSSETVVAKLTDLRAQRASPRATNKAGIMQLASPRCSWAELWRVFLFGTTSDYADFAPDVSANASRDTDVKMAVLKAKNETSLRQA